MISRTCKKILNQSISEIVIQKFLKGNKKLSYEIFDFSDNTISNSLYPDEDIIQCIIDFINLILGVDPESLVFWEGILVKEIRQDFNYSLVNYEKNFGTLLISLLFHFQIEIKVV